MALQVTTRISKLLDVKILHLESTDACQAACPLCARETDSNFNKNQLHHLDMHKIMQVIDADQIAKLDKMFMCGNYGDPAAGKWTLNIFRNFRKLNSDIVLGMNTNGALRSMSWWQELANIFHQPQDYVVFSIDGLEDTNHIYRKNVVWSKLMENVRAYIDAGGSAHWDMLVYQHNQHQVDKCEQTARDLGFTWFRAKVSKRPYVNGLEFPVGWKNPIQQTGVIHCQALQESSLYIDAQGRKHPCCWLGSRLNNFVTFEEVQESWATNPNPICKKTCSSKNNSFQNQWQRNIKLT